MIFIVLFYSTDGLPRLTIGTEITAVTSGKKRKLEDNDTYTLTVSSLSNYHCFVLNINFVSQILAFSG